MASLLEQANKAVFDAQKEFGAYSAEAMQTAGGIYQEYGKALGEDAEEILNTYRNAAALQPGFVDNQINAMMKKAKDALTPKW